MRVQSDIKKRDQTRRCTRHASKHFKRKKASALHLNPLQSSDTVPTLNTADVSLQTSTQKRKPAGLRRVRFGVTTYYQPTSPSEGSSSKDLNMCEQFLAFVPEQRSHRDTDRPSQNQNVILPPPPRQDKNMPVSDSYRIFDSYTPSVASDASLSLYSDRLDQVQMPPRKPYAESHFQYKPTAGASRALHNGFLPSWQGTMATAYSNVLTVAFPSAHDGGSLEFVEF
jgi:hypothetical protein